MREEREILMGERNIDVREKHRLVVHALTGDRTCNLGMCPALKSNPQPFGVWDSAPTN